MFQLSICVDLGFPSSDSAQWVVRAMNLSQNPEKKMNSISKFPAPPRNYLGTMYIYQLSHISAVFRNSE